MAEFDYDTELALKRARSTANELLRLSMPRLEYAKRAALAELDPGPEFAKLRLKRVFPIVIYLKAEDDETEARCRFLMYELLAAARFNVIATLELYGSKLIVLFPENYLPATSESFWANVKEIPFRERLKQAALVATVVIGVYDGLEIYSKLKSESKVPVCAVVTKTGEGTEEGRLPADVWHRVFNAETADEGKGLIESALVLAQVFGKGETDEE
jgi:hypothetical protein